MGPPSCAVEEVTGGGRARLQGNDGRTREEEAGKWETLTEDGEGLAEGAGAQRRRLQLAGRGTGRKNGGGVASGRRSAINWKLKRPRSISEKKKTKTVD